MSGDKIWLKLSSSINHFLRYDYDWNKTDEELLDNYFNWVLPRDFETDKRLYLDKKSFEHIIIDDNMEQKISETFLERVKRKREKLKSKEEIVRKNEKQKNIISIADRTVSKNKKNIDKKAIKNKKKMEKKSKKKNRKK